MNTCVRVFEHVFSNTCLLKMELIANILKIRFKFYRNLNSTGKSACLVARALHTLQGQWDGLGAPRGLAGRRELRLDPPSRPGLATQSSILKDAESE